MSNKTEDNMIEVKGAYKRYEVNTDVLCGLNMTVQRGSIYAFIGPSGCGKTTLLKCIVGRLRLDAGEIILGVQHRSQIGYMPQETALLSEITIKETLCYFGWMYGLKGKELEIRKQELYGFLDIPPENKLIKKLSGGQQRRVSLCVALLNNPDLMILDEPTVGVDPLLSYSIWQCLLKMSITNNKTILLTTHYIEEAKQANKVGMMREGCILAEGETKSIMEEYNCDTLDQVFIKLSSQQETASRSNNKNETGKSYPMLQIRPKLPLAEGRCFSWNNFISLLLKNLYFLKYSPLGWFVVLCIPIMVSIIFEFGIGQQKFHLNLGIVNEELGYNSCDNYNTSCELVSCEYITLLQVQDLNIINYQDIRNAYHDAKKNDIWGYLHFSSNFTQSLYERINNNGLVNDETFAESEISVRIDMSNQVISSYLKTNIYLAFNDFLKWLSLSCSWPTDSLALPITFEPPIYTSEVSDFNHISIAGILMTLEFFLPMTYASAFLEDKMNGILERSFIAGHTATELVAVQIFVTGILFTIQNILLTTIFYGIFHHTFEGYFTLAIGLIILVGISGIFYGISTALFFDNLISATFFVLGTLVPITLLSGTIWPAEGMHKILQSISWFLPLVEATQAYKSIALKSWTMTNPTVYGGFLSSLLWATILGFITIILIKKRLTIC